MSHEPPDSIHRNAIDRTGAPQPGQLESFSFPDFEVYELGGIRVFELICPDVGLTTIQFLANGGGIHGPLDRPGLASFAAAMIDEGAGDLDATSIAQAAEQYGGYISSGSDWDGSGVAVALLTEHLSEVLPVFAQVINEPSFPEAEIDRLKQQRLAERQRRQSDPGALASEAFSRALYGDRHPYGRPLIGRSKDIESLGRDELVAFYRRSFAASGTSIVLVGDHDSAELRAFFEQAFNNLGVGEPMELPEAPSESLDGIEVTLVDRSEGEQTELRVGHIGPARNTEGRAARVVMNGILGGKFTSRINLNLRERNGYTYGANSRFVDRIGKGPFLVGTAVKNEVAAAATREILSELGRICSEPVEDAELDDTKRYIQGVFPYTLQTIQGLSGRLEELAVHDLPLDYYDTMPERIAAVGKEDVLEAAQRFLSPDRLHVVAVGPADQLEAELADLGPVTRHGR